MIRGMIEIRQREWNDSKNQIDLEVIEEESAIMTTNPSFQE